MSNPVVTNPTTPLIVQDKPELKGSDPIDPTTGEWQPIRVPMERGGNKFSYRGFKTQRAGKTLTIVQGPYSQTYLWLVEGSKFRSMRITPDSLMDMFDAPPSGVVVQQGDISQLTEAAQIRMG